MISYEIPIYGLNLPDSCVQAGTNLIELIKISYQRVLET